MRGSLVGRCRHVPRDGPIPADAGEPGGALPTCSARRAYPRGCGGAGALDGRARVEQGLSPRMRGSRMGRARSTLTRAGWVTSSAPPRAYPRGCGGATPDRHVLVRDRGLSPRMRGSPQIHAARAGLVGPIPADAGEPPAPRRARRGSWAYPRGCGGAAVLPCWRLTDTGLSPRMRGSPRRVIRRSGTTGPIPADAGEPRWRARR